MTDQPSPDSESGAPSRFACILDPNVRAMRFETMEDYANILAWMKASGDTCALADEVIYTTPVMIVRTAQGAAVANPGDWVIFNSFEFDVCPKHIFEAVYSSPDQTPEQRKVRIWQNIVDLSGEESSRV